MKTVTRVLMVVALIVLVVLVLGVGWIWMMRVDTVREHDRLCTRFLDSLPELATHLGAGDEGPLALVDAVPETRGDSGYAQNTYWITWPAPGENSEGPGEPHAEPPVHLAVHFESLLDGLDARHDIRFVQLRPRPRNREAAQFVLDLYRQGEGGVRLGKLPDRDTGD